MLTLTNSAEVGDSADRVSSETSISNWRWDWLGTSFMTPVTAKSASSLKRRDLPTGSSPRKYLTAIRSVRTTVLARARAVFGSPETNGNVKTSKIDASA